MELQIFSFLAEPLAAHLGNSAAKALKALKLETVGDLLRHLPRRHFIGTQCSDLQSLQVDEQVAVMARVERTEHYDEYRRAIPLTEDLTGTKAAFGNSRHRLEAIISDGHGRLRLTFFGRPGLVRFWRRNLYSGSRGIFAGKVGIFRDQLQMTHPQFVMLDDAGAVVGHSDANKENFVSLMQNELVPIYPATAKLPTWTIAACIQQLLTLLPEEDPLPAEIREAEGLMPLPQALRKLHLAKQLDEYQAAKRRLIFDEAFATQLTMAARRAEAARSLAIPRPQVADGRAMRLRAQLPFHLTQGQEKVTTEIAQDLAQAHPMNRLLQGEVGSGKTLVALLAMLQIIDNGGQAVLFAPTEVLAKQHYESIKKALGDLLAPQRDLFSDSDVANQEQSVEVVLLTGSMSAIAKKNAMLKIASGAADLVIGTHALLGDKVQFADLGLVVVDEQHRFGVGQRAKLVNKGKERPHVLVMTATPIPRSVAMTMFGDLEVSTLSELPQGRKEIKTTVVEVRKNPSWVTRAWQRMVEEIQAGRQVFLVAPRIATAKAKSEGKANSAAKHSFGSVVDLINQESPTKNKPQADLGARDPLVLPSGVLEWEKWLRNYAGDRFQIGLLHGEMPVTVQEQVMADFVAGKISVLVATTIIEVGVDVPNASMMIITEAERFGVSQLHQLRGRVGRGQYPGLCLLFTEAETGSAALARLVGVAKTNDGFELAELDLKQRKEGDILGNEQSGYNSSLRLLRVLEHADLIRSAYHQAIRCLERDPQLLDAGLQGYLAMIEQLADGDWGEAG